MSKDKCIIYDEEEDPRDEHLKRQSSKEDAGDK